MPRQRKNKRLIYSVMPYLIVLIILGGIYYAYDKGYFTKTIVVQNQFPGNTNIPIEDSEDDLIPQDTAFCTDTDGGQDDQHLIRGTVTTNSLALTDECDWGTGKLQEYYCDETTIKVMYWSCTDGWECWEGKCRQPPCEDIMNADSQDDCTPGYTTDGGQCMYWAGIGCLSTF